MEELSNKIIAWYQENKRDLPWRNTSDPYKIWISEIILQQTRVVQGLDYYIRFVSRFPNVRALAMADLDEVLKLWQGLGYYSRARNLHKAAVQIVEKYDGVFPQKHDQVLGLSGIGVYTAAAVCSFAYNQPYAVVDGNVYRVLSRIFGIETAINSTAGTKMFAALADEFLDKSHPALHNQALMEFGALYCVPQSPDCAHCILQQECVACQQKRVDVLPVKLKTVKVKERFFNYVMFIQGDNTYIRKREGQDIWKNLYEFPLLESDHLFSMEELLNNVEFENLTGSSDAIEIKTVWGPVKHVLTHRIIYANFTHVFVSDNSFMISGYQKIRTEDLDLFAVSRLTEMFLESQQKK